MDTISKGPSVQKYFSGGVLTFAIVPDNTKSGAYDESAKDCSYIIHLASPIPFVPGDLVSQAIAGNNAILEAAEATPSVKRVVFTASTASLQPFELMFIDHPANQAILSGRSEEVETLTAETKVATQPPVSNDAPPQHRYNNSKIAATNLVHEYGATPKFGSSHFSIVNIMPGFVLGPSELVQSKRDAFNNSNVALSWLFAEFSMGQFLSLPADEDVPVSALIVHLNDVVEGHVKSLDTDKVPGKYRNFLFASHSPTGPEMMDAVEIVRREFPREVADGKIPFTGKLRRFQVSQLAVFRADS